MLLRRITVHVSDQNWFAVFIDFLIVVIGVFIGIQVANLNESMSNKQKAKTYVENLKHEVEDALIGSYKTYEYATVKVQSISEVSNYFFEGAAIEALTEQNCDDLAHIQNIFRQNYQLTTVEELVSSGTLNLIQDKEIRNAIVKYKNYMAYMLNIDVTRNINKVVLTAEFPQYFTVRPQFVDGGFINQIFECDFAAMRENPEFLIYFARELSAASYYTHQTILKEKELFDALSLTLGIAGQEQE